MACDISLGRKEPCKDSVGGLDAVYFINYDDVNADETTYDVTDTDLITGINGAVTINAYKYELKGTNSLEGAITSSRENGTSFVQSTLNLSLKKLSIAQHKQVKLLSYGRPRIVVRDRNNNFFLVGLEYGCDVTGGTIATGTAMGDMSGYTLTFTADEKIPYNFIDASSEADLLTVGLTVVEGA